MTNPDGVSALVARLRGGVPWANTDLPGCEMQDFNAASDLMFEAADMIEALSRSPSVRVDRNAVIEECARAVEATAPTPAEQSYVGYIWMRRAAAASVRELTKATP